MNRVPIKKAEPLLTSRLLDVLKTTWDFSAHQAEFSFLRGRYLSQQKCCRECIGSLFPRFLNTLNDRLAVKAR
jgi:hypothetical protein